MAKNEDEQNSDQHQPEDERRFSQQQYDLLKRCSDKKDMTEWNKWRKEHLNEEIWLQGAHLESAKLWYANLKNANLSGAHLENARLWDAHLENARLSKAYLEDAELSESHLENADLMEAHLKNALLVGAHLENALLCEAHLEDAILWDASLRRTNFYFAKLQGADFSRAIVDGETLIWNCKIDNKTNFKGVGLDSARIEPETKQLLEYNIRRMNWEQWYKGKSQNKWIIKMHQFLTLPVRLFWCCSNYGLSTWRIILTFFSLAFVFAVIYWLWPRFVLVNGIVGDIKGFVHALYFSVVTMTTLGFGDIAANPDIWKGQVLLMVQVILGYVLLGALVTRFAVLFTAGGPAGKFAPSKTKATGERK